MFSFLLPGIITGQEKIKPPVTRILLILDASESMAERWETSSKINIARKLLLKTVDSLQFIPGLEMGLRIYGHQSVVPPQDCNDTRLEVPIGLNTADKIKQKLKYVQPKGTTPIAHSLELAAKDFTDCDNCRNIIILFTDGLEACDGDPCAVSQMLQKEGIILKPFIIGIGMDINFKKSFDCIGNYYDAANESKFKEALGVVISQVLNSTTAQINLLDINRNPTETNVNMTLYDNFSGKMKYNLVHTLNSKGNPDTLVLDPLVNYNMTVHTIPPVKVDSIRLTPGKHTIIGVDAPQGYLQLKSSSNQFRDLPCIIRKKAESITLNVQKINSKEKYLVGKYDVEILTLPRLNVNDVDISQSYTTTVEVPSPGLVTFFMNAPGYGSVYVEEDNRLKWIYNLTTQEQQETVTLLPGKYWVSFRAKNSRETIFTISKSFKISSESSIQVRLY
ncbi:MAG: VWA domain-containing protein [Bacteroidia bacterium]|nr:VWA domain-containing protein [Bacteroidia bacterium]